jgi:predicted small metal-binding protein
MPYITEEYYKNEYEGVQVPADSFSRLAKRSSEIVDMLTDHLVSIHGLDAFSDFVQKQVKKATAAQLEYLVTNGERRAQGGGNFGSVRAGNFQYADRAGADQLSREEQMTSAAVLAYLEPTGLLYRGVSVND